MLHPRADRNHEVRELADAQCSAAAIGSSRSRPSVEPFPSSWSIQSSILEDRGDGP